MRIRALLVWGTATSGAVVAVFIGYMFVAARSLDETLLQDRITRAIIAATFEQSEILTDYVLHPGERARIQWRKKQEAIGGLLSKLAASGGGESAMLARMRINHRKSGENFRRLSESLDTPIANGVEGGRRGEAHQHRLAQMRLASQSTLSLAGQMGQRAEESLLQTLHRLSWGVAILVASIVALLAGVWFVVGWRVVRPIARLGQGIRDFKGGQVDSWHGIRAHDEIGSVARAFEEMADNLSKIMVSRDELTKEVETRRQAERNAKASAESLKVRTSELDAVNKELEAFAYSVSHDLRAPLRSMTGFCQALVEDYGDKLDETGMDYVRRVSAACRRMGELINDLLTLSRVTRTEINRTEVNLSELAETIAEQLRHGEPDRIVEFQIEPDVCAQGDEVLLRTMLENLLGNAWKYSSNNPHATIEFGTAADGDETAYYVRDDGVGFDMAYADQLFKPFQRLHGNTEFEGTGIGLASVANIVRRHGGRIWAQSAPGAGTTMQFTLRS